eukprot:461650-Prorocentrum_minimum.AAC.2
MADWAKYKQYLRIGRGAKIKQGSNACEQSASPELLRSASRSLHFRVLGFESGFNVTALPSDSHSHTIYVELETFDFTKSTAYTGCKGWPSEDDS